MCDFGARLAAASARPVRFLLNAEHTGLVLSICRRRERASFACWLHTAVRSPLQPELKCLHTGKRPAVALHSGHPLVSQSLESYHAGTIAHLGCPTPLPTVLSAAAAREATSIYSGSARPQSQPSGSSCYHAHCSSGTRFAFDLSPRASRTGMASLSRCPPAAGATALGSAPLRDSAACSPHSASSPCAWRVRDAGAPAMAFLS
jgi:hypothetical protein